MSVFINQHTRTVEGFSKESGWVILSEIEARIKSKIEQAGIPLKSWDIQINYGIKTGFNEAFIIDQAKHDELLKNCPEADEIIRPILHGRNLKRYNFNWDNQWIIFTKRGVEIDKYPHVKDYLSSFYEHLRPRNNNEETGRKPGPYKWFEIQDNVAYYKDFEKQKIAWGNLALRGQFSIVDAGFYINAPSAFIATEYTYLVAILNSKLADFYIKQLGVTRNGGYFEYKPMFIEQLPIPEISIENQNHLLNLVNSINKSDSGETESKIDQFVYNMYGLTGEEVIFMNSLPSF